MPPRRSRLHLPRPALALAGASLLACGLAACADDPSLGADTAAVIGGEPTAPGEFPGVGALVIEFGGQTMAGCTGTLIAPDAVLTAAHCIDPVLSGGVVPGFTLAVDTTTGNFATVPGASVHPHESFTFDVEITEGLGTFYDIGVLRLAQPITEVAPVPLPRADQAAALTVDLELDIVGYGRTSNDTDDIGVLHDARTRLISLNATELQVGMGLPQPQNCHGDSGGPALADLGDGQRRTVGVVSRSFAGSECTQGGVHTRVDAYLSWIHGQVPTGIPCGSGLAEPCDEPDPEDPDTGGGCCSTGGGRGPAGASAALLALAVAAPLLRRRRRTC